MNKGSAQEFYNSLSADYDSMIGFDASLVKRTEALKNFIPFPHKAGAADLGCGSGLDSIALARLGYDVCGFDISPEMIKTAAANAERLNANVQFYPCAINKIPKEFSGRFSVAVSLGNSLANINRKELILSFKKIYSLLQPGGIMLIQLLNYGRILKEKKRIVGVTGNDNNTFIRFYDFLKDKTYFNILKIESGNKHSLITTEIFPYRKRELSGFIKEAGFKKIKFYGGLNKSEFDEAVSQDLVITAVKQL